MKISVIIPTHNRQALLIENLKALGRQSMPPSQFEVIIIANACRDSTIEAANEFKKHAPFPLRIASLEQAGASAARAIGTGYARYDTLLFLDDDMRAGDDFLQAHLRAQAPNTIVLGYSKPVLNDRPTFWQMESRRWWEDSFSAMRRPGYRFSFRDFFSGNVSLPAALLEKAGGFDPSITGRCEDFELGLRLIRAGAAFKFAASAVAFHQDVADLKPWLHRRRREGVGAAQLCRRHPSMAQEILLMQQKQTKRRVLHLAFDCSRIGNILAQMRLAWTSFFARTRNRRKFRCNAEWLGQYAFWAGVASVMGNRRQYTAWLDSTPPPPQVSRSAPDIDLAEMPSAADLQPLLNEAQQKGVRLLFDGCEVLALPPQTWREPLRQEHLLDEMHQLTAREMVPAKALHLLSKETSLTRRLSYSWKRT